MTQPLTIKKQGNFMAGGSTVTADGQIDFNHPVNSPGQTLHGDHAFVTYQIPQNARKTSLVFLHGAMSSNLAWRTTPDGREGFDTIFLRKNYPVYLLDQPRRGEAARSTISENITAAPDDQLWYHTFRMGEWPNLRSDSQFPDSPKAMDQFFRLMVPNTGAFDEALIADSVSKAFDKIGDGVLITHSQGAGPGWQTVLLSDKVKGVVSFEPGSGFVFPEGEVPAPIETKSPFGPLSASAISLDEFQKLTKIPIAIVYGDFIAKEPSENWPADHWRGRKEMAEKFVATINKYGGDAQVISLPELGIFGNTHFLFAEKNNEEIADVMAEWLAEKGLD